MSTKKPKIEKIRVVLKLDGEIVKGAQMQALKEGFGMRGFSRFVEAVMSHYIIKNKAA